MDDSKWERWSALGGVLFAVLILVAGLMPGSPPKTSDSATKIAKFFADHGGAVRWAAFVGAIGVLAAFWWIGALWRMMRRAEGGDPRLTVVAVAGLIFAASMATAGGIVLAIVPIVGARTLAASGARFFYIMGNNLTIATEFGLAVFLFAASILFIRTKVLPAWLGWFGILVGLVNVVGGAGVSSTRDVFFGFGFGGYLGFVLWVIITSILMFRAVPEGAAASSS